MKKIFVFVLILSGFARANVIGTEYQNFNPSISGKDFTTVHSSETVKQCQCNLGLFFNYAKNTLTYSDFYYQTNTDLKGVRVNDALVGADLYATIGLANNWDLGLALPFVVTARNEDPYGVSYFDKFGLTEIRPMTKYRFMGDDEGGLAVILSANFNTIENNPFAGQNPGPTINIELAGDTTLDGGWKFAGNVGYRKRSSGAQLIDSKTGLRAPFVPFSDTLIYSGAVAANFASIKSDLMAELKGSMPGGSGTDSVKTAQQALELGLGIRHEWTKKLFLDGGVGTKLAEAQSTPDVRVYVGLNYDMGRVCGAPPAPPVVPIKYPTAVVRNHPVGVSDQIDLMMPVTAVDPLDYEAYRWKIGPSSETNCKLEQGYSPETAGQKPILTSIGPVPDGGITLCALAKSSRGVWQNLNTPTVVMWEKQKGYELFRINVSVLFDFDKDILQPRSYAELEKINQHVRKKPFTRVVIEGHTDSKGTDEYNIDLSKRRAHRVLNHMLSVHKWDAKKIKTKYMGEKFPIDTNETDEGRANNRRVEFKVYRK